MLGSSGHVEPFKGDCGCVADATVEERFSTAVVVFVGAVLFSPSISMSPSGPGAEATAVEAGSASTLVVRIAFTVGGSGSEPAASDAAADAAGLLPLALEGDNERPFCRDPFGVLDLDFGSRCDCRCLRPPVPSSSESDNDVSCCFVLSQRRTWMSAALGYMARVSRLTWYPLVLALLILNLILILVIVRKLGHA